MTVDSLTFDGHKNRTVLDRLLSAEIPRRNIDDDPERDSDLGIIIIEVKTNKQGPFTDTLERTEIYRN